MYRACYWRVYLASVCACNPQIAAGKILFSSAFAGLRYYRDKNVQVEFIILQEKLITGFQERKIPPSARRLIALSFGALESDQQALSLSQRVQTSDC